jgi:signal transduction histidine kinase
MNSNIPHPCDTVDFFRNIFNDIPSAIFIIDKHDIIHFYNNTFEEMFGVLQNNALGKLCGNATGCEFAIKEGMDCSKTTHCESCDLRNNYIKSFKTGSVHRQNITKNFFVKGRPETKHFYVINKPVRFIGQEMVLVIMDDITELTDQKNQLELLNRKQNEFIRIAAHDIRSPLSAIYSFSEILLNKSDKITKDKEAEFLENIKKSSKFSLDLLNDILDFSVLESGYLSIKRETLNFVDFIREIIDMNRILCTKKNIKIYVFITNGAYNLNFDKNKIEQVINNLFSNAIKFSPENTSIRISVTRNNDHVLTKIKDQGPGIKIDEIENLFKPFQKGSAIPTNSEKGTGLGLVISKKIIEAHNGHIWVNSEPGKGAEFSFTLPTA